MHPIPVFNRELCIHLAETLLHFLWQGALIAALALGAGVLLRRASAQARYWLYVAALALMAACPVATFVLTAPPRSGVLGGDADSKRVFMVVDKPAASGTSPSSGKRRLAGDLHLSSPKQPATPMPPPPAAETPHRGLRSWAAAFDWQRLAPPIVAGYLAGVLLMLGRLLLAVRGGNSLRERAHAVDDPELLRVLARAAEAFQMRAAPALAWCGQVGVPTVVGLLKPTILLPLTLASGLTPGQVEMLLLHELAHLRRLDHWINMAQWAVETALFFHPAVWLVSRRIRVERELSCDDMVIAAGAERDSYADSLLRMAEVSKAFIPSGAAPAMALGADGQSSKFGERILRLIEGSRHESMRVRRSWPLALLFLGFGVLLAASLNGKGVNARGAGQANNNSGKQVATKTRKIELPVRDQAGKPVTGAEVVLIQHTRSGKKDNAQSFGPVTTDSRGIATFEEVAELPEYVLAAYARVPEKLTGIAEQYVRASKGAEPRVFEITMFPAAKIRGKVTAPAGCDLAGITVRVLGYAIMDGKRPHGTSASGDDLARLPWTFMTDLDKDGNYEIPDMPKEGRIYLAAEGLGLGQGQAMGGSSGGAADFNIAMEREGIIEGTVKGADGRPLVGVTVRAEPNLGFYRLPFMASTDAAGHYAIKGMRTEKYTVQVAIPESLGELTATPVGNVFVKAGQTVTGIDFKLGPGALVHGTVKDSRSGKPLAGATIAAVAPGMGGSGVGEAATSQDGRYTMRIPAGSAHLYIMARPEGYTYPRDRNGIRAPTEGNGRNLVVKDGEEVHRGADFTLDPLGPEDEIRHTRAQGRVLDDQGKPLAGVVIREDVKQPDGRQMQGREMGKTGPDGRYDVEVMVGAEYRLLAGGGDWGYAWSQRFTARDKTVARVEDLKLARATAEIGGVVFDIDGKPLANAQVEIGSPHNWSRERMTDAEGRFRIEKLVDEPVSIYVVQSGKQALSQSGLAPGRRDYAFVYPEMPWSKALTAKEAARLAATAANVECERLYRKRPFAPGDNEAVLENNRWRWGRPDRPGKDGFAAAVSFNTSGGHQQVEVKASAEFTTAAQSMPNKEPILMMGKKDTAPTQELKRILNPESALPDNAIPTRPLSDPDEISGTVIDERKQPIEGVLVDVWTWYPGNETRTTKLGGFSLAKSNASRGMVELRFTKEGYCPLLIAKQPAGALSEPVVLSNRTWFEGELIDLDGNPVPGALIRANQGPVQGPGVHISAIWTETRSDKNGRYKLLVQEGRYDIEVKASGGRAGRLQGITIKKDEAKLLDIPVTQGIAFLARVVDSLTSKPVAGVRLVDHDRPGVDGRSDADGLLRIDGLKPGKLEFNVEANGYARWWSAECVSKWNRRNKDASRGGWQLNFNGLDFELKEGMPPVTIVVERGVKITGRILDPEGKPVAGATAAPARTGSGNSLTGDTRFSVKSQADGTFEMLLPASHECEYNLVAHDGGYGEWRGWANGVAQPIGTKPGDELKGVELRLSRPATVRGIVVDAAGNPVAGREVRASSFDRRENRYYDPTTKTGKDGRFELKFVRPGKHYIQAAPFWLDAKEAPRGKSLVLDVGAGRVTDDVRLEAGEDDE